MGLEIGPELVSDEPLGVSLSQASSGSSWGELAQPGALLRAGSRLKQEGATAIAVVARFPDDMAVMPCRPTAAAVASMRWPVPRR